ncbi:outer membrane protein assembly factor BamE [Algiphilus sp. W345]|uniref:Outer membrane protein assembly factor BamE n=1 Tax=Banduia mediterranea TaxID=3075609 RepID=A0ABU2WL74_9GAMM|nr:outer membrane protein assembly factor BamE [Algiphilus sp. W345]MDT0498636.1 outer membrane protein assembly factor BamE [Algiphilus sp. W345]
MRLLLIVLSAAALISGCQIVYKLPTRQGNVIEQKQLDQLRLGMNREQVEYLLGSPIATDPFRDDRWNYLGYYKSPRGDVSKRIVTLHFEGELLAQMEGTADPNGKDKALENPDVETILQQEKKDKQQTESRETGVILTPEGQ